MARYFIQLAYNGSKFNGWQAQDNTPNTVQKVLQDKISIILGQSIEVVGCGRTDTGVHAKDYFAHFDSVSENLYGEEAHYVYKLNKVLPFDIAVKKIIPVTPEASARFDAISRTYEYLIHQRKDPFLFDRSLYVYGELDTELMNHAASHLLTVTDFTSFSKVNTQAKTNNCNVSFAQWFQVSEYELMFRITANRFLRNMVRAIVGTLLEVGKRKISIDEFKEIVSSKSRSEAGMSVSGHALYLTEIIYPSSLFNGK
ncbi:MAG: truA [Bacteroidota bacterium]|jgi:tRNA pseudouridine38-40 synthase|nr:truA [Bacteroidota bacterium]